VLDGAIAVTPAAPGYGQKSGVSATGTDGPSAGGVVNYEELDQPAVMRRNRSQTIEAMQKSGVEMLDIPAFLRKQAD